MACPTTPISRSPSPILTPISQISHPVSRISNPGSYSRKWKGFTLLELMVVLILVGVVGSLVVVRVGAGLERTRFDAAVKDCAALLRLARNQAVARHGRVEVVYDAAARSLTLWGLVRSQEDEIQAVDLKTYRFPDAVRDFKLVSYEEQETDGAQRIAFAYLGTSKGGKLLLQSSKGIGKIIRITPLTGLISIEDVKG